nr:unnamed protein product [Callosobruchus chinensis]
MSFNDFVLRRANLSNSDPTDVFNRVSQTESIALPRRHSFKFLVVSITENVIWHGHVSSIATAAAKKLGYLFRARKYFSPSNLLTLYKAQIRPSLEYCSHRRGAAASTTLSILDAVQRRAIPLLVENEKCRIFWNCSFPTLELVQADQPDIVLLGHQQKTMFVIEFSAPAEVNIVSKEEEKRTKYQELLGQLRRLWPEYAVNLLVMVIGSLGGMRNTLLSALRAMPVCRAAVHILAARMQKAVILGAFIPGASLTMEWRQREEF